LTVIEWSQEFPRALYLCDEHGTALERLPARIQAPGFSFTAYVRWSGFRDRPQDLILADLGMPVLSAIVEAARERLRIHFRDRSGEVTKALIQDWKDADVYPFPEETTSAVEATERDLFDVVAVAAATAINRTTDRPTRRLTLTLIRESLAQDPTSLRRVLKEVVQLSDEKLHELDTLLARTPLTAIISTAKRISSRLEFLRGLGLLLFEPEAAGVLLERSQLHRILAGETWVFGEEFGLMADDESLTTVLRRHIEILERGLVAIDRPVLDAEGHPRVVDLMFGRALRHNRNKREHLVVELKRPAVRLGAEEVTQIEKYAFAVVGDARFDKTDVQWDFVLVGNELGDYAAKRAQQENLPPGLITQTSGVRIWVRTWAQIIAECEHRLKFVQEALEYLPDHDEALEYLRRTHLNYLPEVLQAEDAARPA
jgi:hypothetical protein